MTVCWKCDERPATHEETGEDDGGEYVCRHTCDTCCQQHLSEREQEAQITACLHFLPEDR